MRNSWFLLALVTLFAFSFMTVIMTYLVRKGLPLIFVLFVVFITVSLVYGTQMLFTGVSIGKVSNTFWLLLLAASALSAIGNLAVVRANVLSPNPGLVNTIVGLQAGVTAILAVWLLKNHLNNLQITGLLIGVVAVIIIALGSRPSTTSTKSRVTTASSSSTETRQH